MTLKKIEYAGTDRILLIFTPTRRLKRRLHRAGDGPVSFCFETEETGLAGELQIVLVRKERSWYLGRECLSGEHPCYMETSAHEKLLLLVSEESNYLEPAPKCLPVRDAGIKIGRAFQNTIFYECCALVNPCHMELFFAEQGRWHMGETAGAVYVNGRLAEKGQPLEMGDTIDLYGLHILLLNGILVCTCFCGLCRIAEDKADRKIQIRREWKPAQQETQKLIKQQKQIRKLHRDEVEILLPEQARHEEVQPLLLGVGPTVTMVLPMLLMASLSSRLMGGAGSGFYYLSVAMSGCSAVLALFWGYTNHLYRKRMNKVREQGKKRQYQQYLEDLADQMEKWQEENREILSERYPPLSELFGQKKKAAGVLWNRYYLQSDFLFLRLGTGKEEFQVKLKLQGKENSLLPDKGTAAARKLTERYADIEQVPVGVDLYQMRQIGIVGMEILPEILGQLAACHSYTEVKVACFYDKNRNEEEELVNCIKWMPHCWSRGRKLRFLAGDEQEAAQILPVLTAAIEKEAAKEKEGRRIPWYVVVILNRELLTGEALYRRLTMEGDICPASMIFVERESAALPKSCRYRLFRESARLSMAYYGEEGVQKKQILPDNCERKELESYLRRMSSFQMQEEPEEEKLPETVSFLELYQCKRVEELDCLQRWEQGHPEIRLRVPIGYRAGGIPVYLDVHEKFHGPHGLLAGTTGSGKSELLQTYLLSLAVSFAPDMLNFCVIDYKGGGTGNVLMALPHCAGVISNLSGREIYRAMAAIASENRKRQQQLSEAGVNHVDAYLSLYREGKVTKPMPHLILVVDEFAELRREEPEFMQEIISLSQVGRSLGIHLLLATQKPAGTVDDKIWSNSRFRLCLRVQDRQDSMDMLHNPDAAALTLPGQGYLQIGNQEACELIQAGYSAGAYQPEKETGKPAALLSITGKRSITADKEQRKCCSQLEAVISYVNLKAQQGRFENAQLLWMPEMPEYLTLETLSGYFGREQEDSWEPPADGLLLGLCDDPGNQNQFPFVYKPTEQGHLVICGGPATGKSTLLQTMIWQIAVGTSFGEALFLIAGVGQENHDCFGEMPECLGILKDPEDREVFFYHLERLIQERKKQLSGISCQIYNRSRSEKLPLVFFFIDNYAALRGILSERQEELMYRLACEGLTCGIYLILTAAGAGEVPGKLFEKLKTTIALEMSDRFQYGDVLRQYHIQVLPKENQKGRGLCRIGENILEFQGALCMDEADDYQRMQRIAAAGRQQADRQGRKAAQIHKFPVIHRNLDYSAFLHKARKQESAGENLPLGYDMATGEPVFFSVQNHRHLLITGREGSGRRTLLCCMAYGLQRAGYRVILVDIAKVMRESYLEQIEVLSTGEDILAWQEQTKNEEQGRICVLIANLGSFCSWLAASGAERMAKQQFWQEAAEGKRKLFLAGICMREQEQEAFGTSFFTALQKNAEGIHTGGNVAEQRVFAYGDLSYSQQNQMEKPGIAYYFSRAASRTKRVWIPMWKGEEEA